MSQYGEHLHLTIFGQSHAPAIGMNAGGPCLPESAIDMERLQGFLKPPRTGSKRVVHPPKKRGCTGISLRSRGGTSPAARL